MSAALALVLAVTVQAGALAACGGGDGAPDESTPGASAADPEASDGAAEASADGTGGSSFGSEHRSPSASAPPNQKAAGTGGSITTAAGGTGATATTTTGGTGTRRYAPPAPGSYLFRTTGTKGSGGQQQSVDETGDMKIEATGADAVRQTAPDGSQIVDLVYRPDGVYMTRFEARYAGGAVVKVFTLPEPVLYGPFPTDPGRSWSWTMRSDDGATTVRQESVVRQPESRRIAGATKPLDVVETHITLSGDVSGTSTVVTWVDRDRRFGTRHTERSEFTSGIFSMKSDTAGELVG